MTDSTLLQRVAAGRSARVESSLTLVEPDGESVDEFSCFGCLRGQRERAAMLELRKRSGDILAIAYGWIERIGYNPSEGITLYAGSQTVRILGSNLNAEMRPTVRLFEGLTRHRVNWVAAQGEGFAQPPAGQTCVEEIMW